MVSGEIFVSEGEFVAASVRNCAIGRANYMTMKRTDHSDPAEGGIEGTLV